MNVPDNTLGGVTPNKAPGVRMSEEDARRVLAAANENYTQVMESTDIGFDDIRALSNMLKDMDNDDFVIVCTDIARLLFEVRVFTDQKDKKRELLESGQVPVESVNRSLVALESKLVGFRSTMEKYLVVAVQRDFSASKGSVSAGVKGQNSVDYPGIGA